MSNNVAYNLRSSDALLCRASSGKLLKWVAGDCFVKTSSINHNDIRPRFMYESYSEVVASALSKDLNITRSVIYKPCSIIIDGRVETVGCYCNNFLKKDEEYISIGHLMEYNKLTLPYGLKAYQVLKKTINNKGFSEVMDDCLLLDYVILNCDRHYGNFGLIKNRHGNIKAVPVFDSGDSLFGSKYINGMKYSSKLVGYVNARPFNPDFEEQLGLVNKRLKLTNLDNTYMALNDLQNNWGLPSERKEFILDIIKSRINKII